MCSRNTKGAHLDVCGNEIVMYNLTQKKPAIFTNIFWKVIEITSPIFLYLWILTMYGSVYFTWKIISYLQLRMKPTGILPMFILCIRNGSSSYPQSIVDWLLQGVFGLLSKTWWELQSGHKRYHRINRLGVIVKSWRLAQNCKRSDNRCDCEDPQEQTIQYHCHKPPVLIFLYTNNSLVLCFWYWSCVIARSILFSFLYRARK